MVSHGLLSRLRRLLSRSACSRCSLRSGLSRLSLPQPFSISLYSLRSWRFSDDHFCVYLVIRLLVVLASLAEISHDLDSLSSAVGCGHMPLLSLFLTLVTSSIVSSLGQLVVVALSLLLPSLPLPFSAASYVLTARYL